MQLYIIERSEYETWHSRAVVTERPDSHAGTFVRRLSPFAKVSGFTKGREVAPMPKQFKPGDYVWYPEISPTGPVVIIVSIPDQQLFVFRNGVRIGRSTVSTGATGHSTPTGVFTILEKDMTHESSLYKGAEMPHMQR